MRPFGARSSCGIPGARFSASMVFTTGAALQSIIKRGQRRGYWSVSAEKCADPGSRKPSIHPGRARLFPPEEGGGAQASKQAEGAAIKGFQAENGRVGRSGGVQAVSEGRATRKEIPFRVAQRSGSRTRPRGLFIGSGGVAEKGKTVLSKPPVVRLESIPDDVPTTHEGCSTGER